MRTQDYQKHRTVKNKIMHLFMVDLRARIFPSLDFKWIMCNYCSCPKYHFVSFSYSRDSYKVKNYACISVFKEGIQKRCRWWICPWQQGESIFTKKIKERKALYWEQMQWRRRKGNWEGIFISGRVEGDVVQINVGVSGCIVDFGW